MKSRIPLTRAGAVADQLRRMIQSGELAPGSRLRQVDIAERFGVSTTPVREAFAALARERLVQQDTHRGVIVFAPSIDDVRENYEIRVVLESLAAELAAELITEEQIEELERLAAEMAWSIRDDPVRHATELNPRFHATIYAAAQRPRLASLIQSLREASLAYLALMVSSDDLPDSYIGAVEREHDEIVAALRARAPRRASRAMRVHLEHNQDQIIRRVEALNAELRGSEGQTPR